MDFEKGLRAVIANSVTEWIKSKGESWGVIDPDKVTFSFSTYSFDFEVETYTETYGLTRVVGWVSPVGHLSIIGVYWTDNNNFQWFEGEEESFNDEL